MPVGSTCKCQSKQKSNGKIKLICQSFILVQCSLVRSVTRTPFLIDSVKNVSRRPIHAFASFVRIFNDWLQSNASHSRQRHHFAFKNSFSLHRNDNVANSQRMDGCKFDFRSGTVHRLLIKCCKQIATVHFQAQSPVAQVQTANRTIYWNSQWMFVNNECRQTDPARSDLSISL